MHFPHVKGRMSLYDLYDSNGCNVSETISCMFTALGG